MGIKERDPLYRDSKRSRERIMCAPSMNYHSFIVRGFWVWCDCMKSIRGIPSRYNRLARNARQYDKWAQ